jgi:phosphohistidine phosphatase
MAQRLLEKNYKIDKILYSSSARTTETMQVFRTVLDVDIKKCLAINELYHASLFQLQETISLINNASNTVILIGHNPGITEFANSLSNVRTDNMPTCAIFAVRSKIEFWTEFKDAEKEFLFYDYPKLK